MALVISKFDSSRYDIIRKSLIDAYEVYLDSEKRNVDRMLRGYKIGQRLTKNGYHFEDDWFTPTGRKRKIPKKVKVQNFEIVDEAFLEKKRVAYTREPSKYLSFKVEIGDWTTTLGFEDWDNITNDEIDKLVNRIPERFRDKVVGFEAHLYPYYGGNEKFFSEISPVFDKATQVKWETELNEYYSAKAAWCSKYGCD